MKLRVIIVSLLLYGQCSCSLAQQVSFTRYTVQDGLVANPIRCIYQDSKGFIWIGTYDGLSRYDGYKFTNYTSVNGLSHSLINSIIEVDGKLMVAENDGSIDVVQHNGLQAGFKGQSAINIVKATRGRVLMTTDAHGFYEYTNGSFISPQ